MNERRIKRSAKKNGQQYYVPSQEVAAGWVFGLEKIGQRADVRRGELSLAPRGKLTGASLIRGTARIIWKSCLSPCLLSLSHWSLP